MHFCNTKTSDIYGLEVKGAQIWSHMATPVWKVWVCTIGIAHGSYSNIKSGKISGKYFSSMLLKQEFIFQTNWACKPAK